MLGSPYHSNTTRLAVSTCISLAAMLVLSAVPAQAETLRQAQWFLDAVHASEAQKITKGAGVVVAVLDSGVDATHPDLAGALLPGVSLNGAKSQAGHTDPQGHGTAMAGLIAARGGGPYKALGIAPRASILPIAVQSEHNDSSIDYASAINYAVEHGAKVINLSISRPDGYSKGEEAAFKNALSHDVVVITASGNRDATSKINTWGNLPGVLMVSGTAQGNSAFTGGLTGPRVALAAPAKDITTPRPLAMFKSGYGTNSGTSEATAIVSGVAALVRAKYPDLNAANVINRLLVSATDLGTAGRDEVYGYGLVNAEAALTMNIPLVTKNPLGEFAASASPTTGTLQTSSTSPAAKLVAGLVILGLPTAFIIWRVIRKKRRRNAEMASYGAGSSPAQVGSAAPGIVVSPPATPQPQQFPPAPPNAPAPPTDGSGPAPQPPYGPQPPAA